MRTVTVPSQVTFRGRIYTKAANFGNLEQARREIRYYRARGARLIMRKFNVETIPGGRLYTRYQLYYGGQKGDGS